MSRDDYAAGLIAGMGQGIGLRYDPDLVFRSSGWHRYLWDTFAATSPDTARASDDGAKTLPRWPAFMRETFTRMYADEAARLESVEAEDAWAEKAHALAEELPEFDRLRDRCRGDRLWSGMAATSLSEEVLAAMPKPDEKLDDTKRLQRAVNGLKSLEGAGVPIQKNDMDAAQKRLQDAQQAMSEYAQQIDDAAVRQAIRRGIEQANDSIDQAVDTMSAFGYGLDDGGDGRGGDIEQKRKLMSSVAKSDKLKKLAALAGRMRRIASRKQRSKVSHTRDEISNITLGDDLARLLPSELVKLSDQDTEILFYKGLVERDLLCYELKGNEPQGRGPIVICVDNSGSMGGAKELWSKAVALALLDIAVKQRRTFAIIHFDTKVKCSLTWEAGPNPPEPGKVLQVMEFFSGGGTDFEPPLRKALELLEHDKFGKADVVLVTDGCAGESFAPEFRRRMAARSATSYGVMIWSASSLGTLKKYCDKVFAVDALTGENQATDVLFEI